MSEIHRGTQFLHAQWLTESNYPLLCEVTKISTGLVYYRAVRDGKLSGTPMLESADKINKRIKQIVR